LSSRNFDIVFLEVQMPDGNGLDVLSEILENPSPPEVIIITDFRTPQDAKVAIEKGAYTGAIKSRDGLIKQAHGGTLFLDEVGELPLSIQKSFLRVIQEHRFRPVGYQQEIGSDFRLIVASNRDLEDMVRQGLFRDDLLYRLRAFTIEVPPLRKHSQDIRELTLYYTAKLCKQFDIAEKVFDPGFFNVLDAYSWPGNVRELIHALESAIIAAQDETAIFPKHLQQQHSFVSQENSILLTRNH